MDNQIRIYHYNSLVESKVNDWRLPNGDRVHIVITGKYITMAHNLTKHKWWIAELRPGSLGTFSGGFE